MELRRSSRRKVPEHDSDSASKIQAKQAVPIVRKRRKPVRKDDIAKPAPFTVRHPHTHAASLARPGFQSQVQPQPCSDLDMVRSCGEKIARLARERRGDQAFQELPRQVKQFSASLQALQAAPEFDTAAWIAQIRTELDQQNNDLVLARALTDPNISDNQAVRLIAKWHSIDMRDVSDIAFMREKPHADRNSRQRSELQLVNKNISRALLQERDTSLTWPEKRRRLGPSQPSESAKCDPDDQFENIPLLS